MSTFNPDKYLQKTEKKQEEFNPDKYLKKKDYSQEDLESAKTSLQGVSIAPNELESALLSTTDESITKRQKLTKKLESLDGVVKSLRSSQDRQSFATHFPDKLDQRKNINKILEEGEFIDAYEDIAALETDLRQDRDRYAKYVNDAKLNETETAAGRLIDKTKELNDLYNDAKERSALGNIGKGTVEGFQDYFRDYSNLIKDFKDNKAIQALNKKMESMNKGADLELTGDEALLLQSMIVNAELTQEVYKDLPASREIGEMVGQSLAFMGEFVATAGVGKGATTAVKTGMKGISSMGKLGRITTNLTSKLGGAGVQVLAMPTFYKEAAKKFALTDKVGASTWDAYTDQLIEVFSERLFMGKVGSGATRSAAQNFIERTGNAVANAKGWKGVVLGFVEEIAEEKLVEIGQGIKSAESFGEFWNQFVDVENNLKMMASVGIITGTLGSAQLGLRKTAEKLNNSRIESLREKIPESVRNSVDEMLLNNDNVSAEEIYKEIENNINREVDNGNMNDKDAMSIAKDAIEYTTLRLSKIPAEKQGKQLERDIELEDGVKLNVQLNEDGTHNIGNEQPSRKQAEEVVEKLQDKYPNSEFEIQDKTNREDFLAEGKYQIVAKPKNVEMQLKPVEVLRQELADMKRRLAEGSKDPGLPLQIQQWENAIEQQERQAEQEKKQEAEQELEAEEQPSYQIGEKTFTDKGEFLEEIKQLQDIENLPEINIRNDEQATEELNAILGAKWNDRGTQIDSETQTTTQKKEGLKRAEKLQNEIEVLEREKSSLQESLKEVPEDQKGKIEQEISQIDSEIQKKEESYAQESPQVRQEAPEEGVQQEEQLGDMPELTEQEKEKQQKEEVEVYDPQQEKVVTKKQADVQEGDVTREQFKQNFLSDEVNLRGIDVPLKQREREAARQNLIEGKDTKQARILNDYIEESFDKGAMDVIYEPAGGKTVRQQAPLSSVVKGEQPAVKGEPTKTETEPTKPKEPTPKTERSDRGKKRIAERFKSQEEKTRGKNTRSYKIVDENSEKSEYKQDERKQRGVEIVKQNIDENGNVNEERLFEDIAKTDGDVGNFALSELEQLYRQHSYNEEFSPKQREFYEEKASRIVNIMADRAEQQGREVYSWKAIAAENPALDARVRFLNTIQKNRDNKLGETLEDGETVKEYIDNLRQQLEAEIGKEVEKLTKENVRLRNAINNIQKEKKSRTSKQAAKELADQVRRLKTPKDLMFATPIPFQAVWNPSVELVAKAIEGGGELIDAIQQGLNWIKNTDWYKKLNKAEQDRFDKFYQEKVKRDLEQFKSIESVVQDHYTKPEDVRSLTEKLMDDAGLTEKQARKINSIVGKEVSKRVRDKLVEIKEKRDTKWKPSEVERITEALVEGNLADEDWVNSFAKKFDFTPISKEYAQVLQDMARLIEQAKIKGEKYFARWTGIEFANKIKKLRKPEMHDIFQEINSWHYASMMSGMGTFWNSNVGSTLSATLEHVPYLASKGLLPGILAVRESAKFTPAHFREFMEINNTNRGFYDNLGLMDESYDPRNETKLSMAMARPLLSATSELVKSIKNKEDIKKIKAASKDFALQTVAKSFIVSSTIKATDAFLRGTMSDQTVFLEEFAQVSKDLGYKRVPGVIDVLTNMGKVRKVLDETRKKTGMDTYMNKQFKQQAQAEAETKRKNGVKLPPNYVSRRAYELRLEHGDEARYRSAILSATDAVMLGTPDGLPGWVYQGLNRRLFNYIPGNMGHNVGTFISRSYLVFTRIMMNFANRAIAGIPGIGLLNAVMGYDVDPRTGKGKFTFRKEDTRKMTKRIATHLILTAAQGIVFMDTFDWDDDEERLVPAPDRHFDFTAWGTGDYKRDKQYGLDKNFAFRFRMDTDKPFDEDWTSIYLAPHIIAGLGIMGRMLDDEKGVMSNKRQELLMQRKAELSETDKEVMKWARRMASMGNDFTNATIRGMGEAQYNSLSRHISKFKGNEDKVRAGMMATIAIISEPAKVMLQPYVVKDVINEIYRQNMIMEKDKYGGMTVGDITIGDEATSILNDFYISEMFMNENMEDLYGNPIPRINRYYKFKNQYLEMYKDKPEYKLLYKYDALERPYTAWLPAKEGYTQEDKFDARKYARRSFGEYVKNGLEFFNDLPKEDLEFALNSAWEVAKDDGTYYVDYRKQNPDISEEKLMEQYEKYRSSPVAMKKFHEAMLKGYSIDMDEIRTKQKESILKMKTQSSIRK